MKKISKKFLGIALGRTALSAAAAPAMAGPFMTIAAYNVDDPALAGGPGFTFTNSGAASTFTSTLTPEEVSFAYTTSANSYSPGSDGTPIDAMMSLSSTVSSTASTNGGDDVQPLDNVVISFTTVASDSHGAGHNLLTVTIASTGLIYGPDSGDVADMKGDNTVPDTLVMTSDYLDFSAATEEGYVTEFSGVNPALGIAGNGFLSSFTAYGSGQFASDSTGNTGGGVPEPASLALVGLGALGLLARRGKGPRA